MLRFVHYSDVTWATYAVSTHWQLDCLYNSSFGLMSKETLMVQYVEEFFFTESCLLVQFYQLLSTPRPPPPLTYPPPPPPHTHTHTHTTHPHPTPMVMSMGNLTYSISITFILRHLKWEAYGKKYIDNSLSFSYSKYIYIGCLTIQNIVLPWCHILRRFRFAHDLYLDRKVIDDVI